MPAHCPCKAGQSLADTLISVLTASVAAPSEQMFSQHSVTSQLSAWVQAVQDMDAASCDKAGTQQCMQQGSSGGWGHAWCVGRSTRSLILPRNLSVG